MKKSVLIFAMLLLSIIINAQTQIGQDINGEAANDHSGNSVSINSDGTIVAIGAYRNSGNGNGAGHVRVYKNIGGVWTQIGQDIDGEATGDQSGYSVSINSDGSVVAIGAIGNDGNGFNAGQVRVYENISGTWTQIGQDIDGETNDDQSGYSVSINSDGTIVAISAPNNDGNGTNSGQVRVYKNISGTWTQIGQDIDGETANDYSGNSVSINSDGTIVAIGATDNDGNGTDAGQVRVYKNISGTWTQIGQDIDGETANDCSGFSVSINSDGSIVAIGTPFNNGNGLEAGHVRVYKNISGVWTQIGQDIDGEAAYEQSGYSVSINSDGSIVAIGSPHNNDNGNDAGQVRTYKNISGVWTKIGQGINGEAANDRSAMSVSLNSDGLFVAIGAMGNDGNGTDAGQVRIFNTCNTTYSSITETVCDNYTSPSGKIWNITGIYKDTIQNANGCDSIITINLTVNYSINITAQPNNIDVCLNKDVAFTISVTGTDLNYQWKKNDTNITGANNDILIIYNAQLSDTGNYICEISNMCGIITSDTVKLTVNPLPIINLQDYNQCTGSFVTIEANVTSGTSSYTYNWSQGGTTNTITVAPMDTISYTLIVTDSKGCKDTAQTTVNVLFPYQEQICMVTVDTLTGNNKIIWEKTFDKRTEKYRIYREGAAVGTYNLLGEKVFNEMSEFIDVTADPMAQPYKYKITTVDSVCANESPIDSCLYHKTIHLQTSLGSPNGYQLSWTEYEGFPYVTYNIYGRETGMGSFSLVHQSAYGMNTWTDGTTVPSMEYRIAVEKSDPCIPTSDAKTSGGPYSHSLSNIDDYSINPSGIINKNRLGIYIYPNPCSGIFTVRGENISKIEVTDIKGKIIFTTTDIKEFNNIDISNKTKGVYLVKIICDSSIYTEKVILK